MASRNQVQAISIVTAMVAMRRPKHPTDKYHLGPNQIAQRVIDIHRLGTTLFRLYEDDSDLPKSERRVKREAQLEAKAAAIGHELGVSLVFQDDPRGWPVIVLFPGETSTGAEPRLGGRN